MRIASYFGASVSFLLIYVSAAIVSAVLVSAYADWATKDGPIWWATNVVPFAIVIIAGVVGVYIASAITSKLFPKLNQWHVSLIFVAILSLHQIVNLILIIARQDWSIIDIRGAVMALAAVITAIDIVPNYNRR